MQKKVFHTWFITVSLILSCSVISAQSKHEFLFNLGGGLSTLQYAPTVGLQKNGLGGQFGFGYHLFFNNWAVTTGIELALCNSAFNLNVDKLDINYTTKDRDDSDFDFRSVIEDYREKQRSWQLQIPLMAQYQYIVNKEQRYYAAAGMKVGIPISGKYSTSGGNITNTGYYSEENYTYGQKGDDHKFIGFGDFNASDTDGSLKLNISYYASVEIGVKFNLEKLWEGGSIYICGYFDYGLNNVAKIENIPLSGRQLIDYNPKSYDDNFTINSVIYSETEGRRVAEKIHPMAAGIKVKISYGIGTATTRGYTPSYRSIRR